MARNVEIKIRITPEDLARIEKVAQKLGRGPKILQQVDTYFNTHDGRLKLREFADAKAELISYTRSNVAEPRLCDYQRFAIDDPQELKSMLEKSVGISCVVEKKRTVYLIDQARIHLDQVLKLGEFLEIEVVLRPEQMEEVGQDILQSLLEQFELSAEQFESLAYADLLLAINETPS